MTPERKLQALFAEEAPSARDWAFEAVVAERIARRRAVFSVAAIAPWAAVGALALWAGEPMLRAAGETLAALNPAAPLVVGGGLAAGLALWLTQRLTPSA